MGREAPMQIKANIESHIEKNSLLPNIKALLFFGPDNGVVHYRFSILKDLAIKNSFEQINFSYSEIKDNLSIIADEANSNSLFSTKRIIFITLDASVIKKELSAIITSNKGSLIVLIAGDLSTKSDLRKIFEAGESIFSYGCYSMTAYDREKFAMNYVQSKSLALPAAWVKKTALMVQDVAMLTGELEKLAIYRLGCSAGDDRDNLLDDLVCSFSEYSFLDFAYAYALGDKKKMLIEYYKASFSGVQVISLIRVLVNFHVRLFLYKLSKDVYGAEAAMMKISPPVFFKEKPDFQKVDSIKNLEALVDKIDNLNKIELVMKSGLMDGDSLFINFLLHDDETSNIYLVKELMDMRNF
jgi:DNA polymerase-3 subunit delta